MSKKLNGKAKAKARAKAFKAKQASKATKATVKSLLHPNTDLVGFYWGYKANDNVNGFEFSNMTLDAMGMSRVDAIQMGAHFKECADKQVSVLKTNRTMQVYNQSREEFVAEEKARMIWASKELAKMTKGPFQFNKDLIQNLIIWTCAISTCVAAGVLEQDEWNGDKFSHVQCADPSIRAAMFGETA